MKRILYISDVDISTSGGAQESMKILMEELGGDFEFFLLTPKGKRINKNHIILNDYKDFILRGKSFLILFKMTKDILTEIKKINPQIIHIQMPSTLIIVNFLFTIGLLNKNIKIVYTDRGVYSKYGKITTLSINSLIKKAHKVVVTTEMNKKNYINLYKKYHKYSNKFKVIYNTGGKLYNEYNSNLRNEMRKKLKIKKNEFVIGFCGRFSEQKNWPMSKEIIDRLSTNIDVKFIVVIGTDGSEKNYNEVINFLQELENVVKKDKVISFINLSNEKMNIIYYAMDCFVLTSKWESFGRTAVEAMSRKNIVLGTNVDGIPEVIGREDCVFNSVEEAVKKIIYFKNNETELEKAKKFFFNRYHSLFCYKINITKYKELYDDLLN